MCLTWNVTMTLYGSKFNNNEIRCNLINSMNSIAALWFRKFWLEIRQTFIVSTFQLSLFQYKIKYSYWAYCVRYCLNLNTLQVEYFPNNKVYWKQSSHMWTSKAVPYTRCVVNIMELKWIPNTRSLWPCFVTFPGIHFQYGQVYMNNCLTVGLQYW